jgi:hypothetical protein
MDGHNWMFPVAFGFLKVKPLKIGSGLEQLQKAIGNPPHLAISSDACKGLAAAMRAVYPWVEHRECVFAVDEKLFQELLWSCVWQNVASSKNLQA